LAFIYIRLFDEMFCITRVAMNDEYHIRRETAHKLARRALFGFLLTFILSRVCVFLIMSKELPNMYLFMGSGHVHVHHLNYGIFLLAAVAGYSVFRRPVGRRAEMTAVLYGIAMGLTFDEFGMWLHLGGSYWQRASVDAVVALATVFGMIAFAPNLKKFESHHFLEFAIAAVFFIGFMVVLYIAGTRLGTLVGPTLQTLEAASSP
jgi:hypothetical protein